MAASSIEGFEFQGKMVDGSSWFVSKNVSDEIIKSLQDTAQHHFFLPVAGAGGKASGDDVVLVLANVSWVGPRGHNP